MPTGTLPALSYLAPDCARSRLRPFSRNPSPVEKGIYVLNAIALPNPNTRAWPRSPINPTNPTPRFSQVPPPGTKRH